MESLDFSIASIIYRVNSKLDCCFSIIKEINICFLPSNIVILYDMGMDVTAFNDFVERFFF